MYKNNSYIRLDSRIEKLLRKSKVLGHGHNGIVYILPSKKAIKIFKDKNVCAMEYSILKKTSKSKYFPKIYEHGAYYIIRDCVNGERLDKYIKKHGFNRKIASNLITLIKEFEKLNFNKLDIRCKDLFIEKDFSLMVIDPKNNYSKNVIYPRHLMKGLNKFGVLDEFLEVVNDEYSEVYELWSFKIKNYLENGIK